MARRSEEKKDRDREEPELVERLVGINRVAKVVKGGRRFGFAALMIVGDGRGRVGHGHAKAREVPEAIKKATEQARRNMIRVPLREGRTIHHDVHGRDGAGKVFLRSAPAGTGIIAGGPMRAVFEAIGIQDIVAKAIGSNNPYSMVNATFAALKDIQSPRHVAARRDRKISDIVSNRELEAGAELLADKGKEASEG
ncbi:MAG: 30S ribosomal protein S5 [Alphaproteobacteria bacterium]|nr:30S ribosomal protein S5 [Alphaproteobacteria bacterium]